MTKPTSIRSKKSAPPQNLKYVDMMIAALALLCGGKEPNRADVIGWEDHSSEELQSWAACNTALPWATGIGTIEAAQELARTPEEGQGHETQEDAFPHIHQPSDLSAVTPSDEARSLAGKLSDAFGEGDWALNMRKDGAGSVESDVQIIYFDSPRHLDESILEEILRVNA